jgi:hypothetical protein
MIHLVTLLKPTWSNVDAPGCYIGRFGRLKVRLEGPPIPTFPMDDAPLQKISHRNGG